MERERPGKLLAMHADSVEKKGAVYLFESSWKKKYTDRGIRKILKKYSDQAGMVHLFYCINYGTSS
jgi:hypothetical protein